MYNKFLVLESVSEFAAFW